MPTPSEILKRYWGYDNFRPLQEDIIKSVLDGKDTLALLPTGGGKSICYQVPALCKEGICLVITPLIALMTDQVENLKRRGIGAVEIHTGLHPREITLNIEKCADGRAKLLYVSPERLESRRFREQLTQLPISLIAVDEAHCISQWGYDFRPSYLKIQEIRQLLPWIPVIALTATAVENVVEDIQDKLAFRKHNVLKKSFFRKNLAYWVYETDDKFKKLLQICHHIKGCGIVYVNSRRQTREISDFLSYNNLKTGVYHAGMLPKDRLKQQTDWINNKTHIMVATNAFGMGIDKPDVRFVVHMDLPNTIEAYFQEAGRAGRDEKKAFATLIFNNSDIENLNQRYLQAWPEASVVKNTYQALGNFLQIPVSGGRDRFFNFDFEKFCTHYTFKPAIAFNALKILERDGYIIMSEGWQEFSKIYFLCEKHELYQYQVKDASFDAVIKVILRLYSGVFTDFTKISENEIARKTGIDSPRVTEILMQLQRKGILDYTPRTTASQIQFFPERLDISHIQLSKTFYAERKKDALLKMKAMVAYAQNDEKCRSISLLEYFGEKNEENCGICNVCVQKKRKNPENEIRSTIIEYIQQSQTTIENLIIQLPQYAEKDILACLRKMIENETIVQVKEWVMLPKKKYGKG